jgi:hypothetical protein
MSKAILTEQAQIKLDNDSDDYALSSVAHVEVMWNEYDDTIITEEAHLRDEHIDHHAKSGTFSSMLRTAKKICEPEMFK